MKNRFVIALVTVFLVLGSLAVVCAQDEGQPGPNGNPPSGGRWGGPNGGGGRMQMPEGLRNTMQLMRLPRQISELNKDKKTALTPGQAKQILAILKPLRSKSKLPSDQAKLVSERIHKVLTGAQIDAMSSQRGFGRGGGRHGGEGREPGQGGNPGWGGQHGQNGGGDQQHARPRFDPAAMKDMNPFYPTKTAKGDTRAEDRAKHMNDFFADLEARAKGK